MSSPEAASATRSALVQDWLYALRYWLRGRRGLIVLAVAIVALGAALNWSWLVAAGIAPLLLTALPCVAMCAVGLCMNRMTGGSCSTSARGSDHVGASKPDTAQPLVASESIAGASALQASKTGSMPDYPTGGAVEPAPLQQPHVQKERE